MCSVISVDALTSLAFFTVGADIRRPVQPGTAFGYVVIAYLETNVVRAVFASLEITPVNRGVFTDVVADTTVFINTVVLAFRGKALHEPAVITHLS